MMIAATTKHRMRLLTCSMFIMVAATGAVQAQGVSATTAPSESAMVNLVRLLVKQGVLKKETGEALMAQAESEAVQARAAAPVAQTAQAALPDAAPGTIRVPYIPETVRNQIRDEIRTEVLAKAKTEGWASAGQAAPDWTKRITPFGDIRFRSQSNLYSKTNSPFIFDFARINAQGPTNLDGGVLPYLNSRVNRVNRLSLRARLGAQVNVTSGVSAVFAVATGDDDSPISTNQSLGGGLSKRDLWLDQAYIKLAPSDLFQSTFGRFPNPFESTDLLFDDDLRFDGVAANFNAGSLISDDIELSIRGGAFPLDFGSGDFPNTNPVKEKVQTKYLYSGQIAAAVTVLNGIKVRASGAYHSFQGLRGRLSQDCFLYLNVTECSTDPSRAFSLRKGNSLFGIRRIVLNPANPSSFATNDNNQLLGLTFDYDVLDINGSIKVPVADAVFATLGGSYVRNLAFKRSDVCRLGELGAPLNNGGAGGTGGICALVDPQPFVGGPTGYQVKAELGHDSVVKRGQWNVTAGYRYLESDAVLDSLTDSDFHLGGTNAKGYFVGGRYGIFDNVTIGGRWMSANQISGEEPLAIDVLQVDLVTKF
jgi:Putative porin